MITFQAAQIIIPNIMGSRHPQKFAGTKPKIYRNPERVLDKTNFLSNEYSSVSGQTSDNPRKKTKDEIDLEKFSLKIHGQTYDDPDSSGESGRSDFDEEYYKYKPDPIIVNSNDLIIIKKAVNEPNSNIYNHNNDNEYGKHTTEHLEQKSIFTISNTKKDIIVDHLESWRNYEKGLPKIHDTPKLMRQIPITHHESKADNSCNRENPIDKPLKNMVNGPGIKSQQEHFSVSKSNSGTGQSGNSNIPSIHAPNQIVSKEIPNYNIFQLKHTTEDVSKSKLLEKNDNGRLPKDNELNNISKDSQPNSSSAGSLKVVTNEFVVSNNAIVVGDSQRDDETQVFGETDSCWTKFFQFMCCSF